MVRVKPQQPKRHRSLRGRRIPTSNSSTSIDNSSENRNSSSHSNQNPTTTSRTSTGSTRASNEHASDELCARRTTKKRPKNVYYRTQHLQQILVVSKKTLKEIRLLQRCTENLLPRLSFQRVVREIMQNICEGHLKRIQTAALRALQEAAEMYLTQLMEDSYFCTLHANRKTLKPVDMRCVRRIRGLADIINH